MGSQWVQDLVRMADALVLTAEDAKKHGADCRFCGCSQSGPVAAHAQDCPVTLANTVLKQARKRFDA